jgi:lysozyme
MVLSHVPPIEGTTGLVVDVSGNQPNVDFAVAKRDGGVVAAFLKATEGATYLDPSFLSHYDKAAAAGLRIGVYHFGTARPAADQVGNFVNAVKRVAGSFDHLVPVLDLEHNDPSPDNTMSPDLGVAWVEAFVKETGRQPMIYAGAYLRDQGGATDRPALAAGPLWLAAYLKAPVVIPGWPNWTFWQFTGDRLGPWAGEVPGLGWCDQSLFNGDAAALDAFWPPAG